MRPTSPWAGAAACGLALVLAMTPAPAGAQEAIELQRVATFPEGFGYLQTVRPLEEGRVMVADPLGLILGIADMESGGLEILGREGGGPGEWGQPDAVYPLPGDSTLLVDLGNARLSIIDPDGEIVGSQSMVLENDDAGLMGMDILTPGGVDGAGNIYFQARGGMTRPGGAMDSSTVKRWVRGDETATAVARLTPPAVTVATSGGANDQRVTINPVPLAPQDAWAVAPDGRLAVVRAEPYRVEWYAPDGPGGVVRGPEVSYRPVRVRNPERERYLDEMETGGLSIGITDENGVRTMSFRRGGSGSPENRAAQMRALDWPDELPAIREGGAIVAPDGRLWVQRFVAAGDPVRYDIFDGDGERVAVAELPPGRSIIGFHRDRVYAVMVDDLGLNWLEAYTRR